MTVLCFGISHHTAPMALLESLSFTSDVMRELLVALRDGKTIREVVGLSTCNRTEFYLEASSVASARDHVVEMLTRHSRAQRSMLEEHCFLHTDTNAIRHLFQVASGVDSLIVGERQILGQLRDAVAIAEGAGTAGAVLGPLFTRCIRTGRRAQTETNIGRGNVSVASVAVNVARKVFSDLSRKRVLIIGAGETAHLALTHLAKCGIGTIVIANRTRSRAEELAKEFEGQAIGFDQIPEALPSADIVVCATGSQEYLLTASMVKRAAKEWTGRTVVMLDLSLPRNIEPAAGKLDQVFLYGIEDLEFLARENRSQRESEITSVEAIIDEEVADYLQLAARSDVERMIRDLRRRVEKTRKRHLEHYGKKLSPEMHKQYDTMTESLLRGVLHDLTRNLRSLDSQSESGRQEFHMARRLLNLQQQDSDGEQG